MATVIDIAKLVFEAEDQATAKITKMNKALEKNEQAIESNRQQNEKWERGLDNNKTAIDQYSQKLAVQNEQLELAELNLKQVTASEVANAKAIQTAKSQLLAKQVAIINTNIALEKLNQSQTEYSAKIAKNVKETEKLIAANKKLDSEYEGLVGDLLKAGKAHKSLYDKYVKEGSALDKLVRKGKSYAESLQDQINKTRKETKEFQTNYSTINKLITGVTKLKNSKEKYSTTVNTVLRATNKEESSMKKLNSLYTRENSSLTKLRTGLTKYASKTRDVVTQNTKAATSLRKEDKQMTGLKQSTKQATNELKKFNASNKVASKTSGNFRIGNVALIAGSISAGTVAVAELTKASMQYLQVQDNVSRAVRDSFENQTLYNQAEEALVTTLGINSTQFAQSTIQISNQAKTYGLATEEAEKYAVAGSTLAGVLAATNLKGYDYAETSNRIITALRGEAEAAEELGLALGATQMEEFTTRVQENGAAVEGTWSTMDADVQMKLRLASAVEQVSIQTGINITEMKNMEDVYANVITIVSEFSDNLTVTQQAIIMFRVEMAQLYQDIKPIAQLLAVLGGVILVALANIIGLVADGVTVFGQALAFAYTSIPGFATGLTVIWQVLQLLGTLLGTVINIAFTAFAGLVVFVTQALAGLSVILSPVILYFQNLANTLSAILVPALTNILTIFGLLVTPIIQLVTGAVAMTQSFGFLGIIMNQLSLIGEAITSAFYHIMTVFTGTTDTSTAMTQGFALLSIVMRGVHGLVASGQIIWTSLQDILITLAETGVKHVTLAIETLGNVLGILEPVILLVTNIFFELSNLLAGALATALDGASNAFNRISNMIEVWVYPAIERIVTIMTLALVPILEAVQEHLIPLIQTFLELAQKLAGIVVEAIILLLSKLNPLINAFKRLLERVVPPLINIFEVLTDTLKHVIENAIMPVVDAISNQLEPIIDILIAIVVVMIDEFSEAIGIFLRTANMIITILSPVVEILIEVIGKLIAIIIEVVGTIASALMPILTNLYGVFQEVITVVLDLWNALAAMLKPILDLLVEVLGFLFDAIMKLVDMALPYLQKAVEILAPPLELVFNIVEKGIDLIKSLVTWVHNAADAFTSWLDSINPFANVADKVSGWFNVGTVTADVDVEYNTIGKPSLDSLQAGRAFGKSFLGTNVYGSNGKQEYNYHVHTTQPVTPASARRQEAVWRVQGL